jgi:tetratricopeptide (TPR) repeat protein
MPASLPRQPKVMPLMEKINRFLFLVLLCFAAIMLLSAAASHSREDLNNNCQSAQDCFNLGREYFKQKKFPQAHSFFTQAIDLAQRAISFEKTTPRRVQELKGLIRQSRNQKSRIRQTMAYFRTLIEEKKIAAGMNPQQVRDSWGEPETIEKTLVKWKESQKWIYGNVLLDNDKYVLFEDGFVVDFQDGTKY